MYKKSKDHSNCSPAHPDLFPRQSYCSPKVEAHPALHISSDWVAVPCLSPPVDLSGSMHTCTFVYSSLPDMQPRRGFWKIAQLHTIHTADIQLLVAKQVLLTPSVSKELYSATGHGANILSSESFYSCTQMKREVVVQV